MVTPTDDYYAAHDGGNFAPLEATTVATWKAPAFLENLAVDAEGRYSSPPTLTILSIATIRRRI